MRTIILSLLAFLVFQVNAQSSKTLVIFEDVNVVPMDSERILEHQTVTTENGKITSIVPYKKSTYPKNAILVDGKGKYLMPGLAELHGHVPPIDDLEPMKEVLKLFVLNGITTVRGMLGHPKHLELREQVNSGKILSPHFYTTGPSLNGMSVKSPEDGAALVRKQKHAGYDFLKLHPGLSRQKFDSIAATAKRVNIPFAGHVSFGVGVYRAIEAGYSSIDHMDGFVESLVPGIETMVEQQTGLFGMFVGDRADTTRIPALMKALKENSIWVVPTQSLAERWMSPDYTSADFKNDPARIYMKPETIQQWITVKDNLMNNPEYNVTKIQNFIELRRRLIRECQKNGIGLLLGCDAPQIFNVPGFSTHNELEYLVRAGLTPYEALQTGTVNVARYLNVKDSGVVRKGAISDLILVHGNPLKDITQTKNISGVMIGSTWMPREVIDRELKTLVRE
jgi:imidazolonepropionase-like amidohydrolase